MRKITYSCLIQMRTNALWAIEIWYSEMQKDTNGAVVEYVRYCKIFKRIEAAMDRVKPASNEFREVGV